VVQEINAQDAYIRWTSDSSASTSFFMHSSGAPAWGTSAGTVSVARIAWQKANGTSGCSEYYPNFSSGQEALLTSATTTGLSLFVSSYPNTKLDNYAGLPIPLAPATTAYIGSVDCGYDALSSMLITQDGITFSVALSYESQYRASWTARLTDSPYTISAGCGDLAVPSAPSNDPYYPTPPMSRDWMCGTTTTPRSCILS
jgi:hypothetical protein